MTNRSFKNKILVRSTAITVAFIFILSLMALVGCSSSKNENKMGASVKKEGEKLVVKASVSSDKRDVYLFAIGSWQSPSDISGMTPLVKAKVKNREAKAELEVGEELSELLCKGFVFGMEDEDGKSYDPVSDVYYVTNPVKVNKDAPKDISLPAGDIKGLIGSPARLSELGAEKTVLTVDVSKLLRGTGGEGAVSVVFDGVSCHIDRNEMEKLDAEIKAYTELGITVLLEIVQTRSFNELDTQIRNIAFEGVTGADGYALNMLSRDGSTRICALFDFISDRYTTGEYGRIGGMIIGRRVNSFGRYYASKLDTENAVKNYVYAVRMAYNLLSSKDPSARVYAALGNNWRFADVGGLSAADMLTTFANLAENGGDFFWQLCMEANASDASNSAIWNDNLAGNDPRFISPINISFVTDLLSSSPYQFEGLQRNVLLNRFAIGGSDEDKQATSYAYAYYKCLENGKVDGLIYASVVDGEQGATKTGLYSYSGALTSTPKKIGVVFESVDSGKMKDATYVSELLGGVWDELYDKNADAAFSRRLTNVSSTDDHSRVVLSVLADFANGSADGFVPVSAKYAELSFSESRGCPVLYVAVDPQMSRDGAGAVSGSISLKDLRGAGYLTLAAMVNSVGEDTEITVTLSGYDKKGIKNVFTSTNKVRSGEWIDMYYDVEEFVKTIDGERLTLSVTTRSSSADGSVNGLWIARIATEEPIDDSFPVWIIWTLVGLVAAGGITAFVIWFNKNYTFVREEVYIDEPSDGRKEQK